MLNIEHIRSQFPIFSTHPETIFFDNAATAQRPQSVIDVITKFYTHDCANAGRSVYKMSTTLKQRTEEARSRVAKFIGARSQDLCFTSGATEALNLVPLTWGLTNLQSGDQIMLCPDDHESAIKPWFNLQELLARFGIKIKIVFFKLQPTGIYDLQSIANAVTPRTKLLSMTHVHHLYGLPMPVRQIRNLLGKEVLISLDASQSIGHTNVNIKNLPVDFLCFSGHKVFAGNGSGALWVSPKLRGQLRPVIVGGGTSDQTTASLLEAGTQNTPAILSMGAAINYLETIGMSTIKDRLDELTKYLYANLKRLREIEFAPGVHSFNCRRGLGVISFRCRHKTTEDIASFLANQNILVRSKSKGELNAHKGDHFIRVSLHIYNTEAEIDRFIEVLSSAL